MKRLKTLVEFQQLNEREIDQGEIIEGFHNVRRDLTSMLGRVAGLTDEAKRGGFKNLEQTGTHIFIMIDKARDLLIRRLS